jgi:tRNA nucleotidyltransferase (CCA-adding enzyme)
MVKHRAGCSAAAVMVASSRRETLLQGRRDVNVPKCFEYSAAEGYVSHQTVPAVMMAYVPSARSRGSG